MDRSFDSVMVVDESFDQQKFHNVAKLLLFLLETSDFFAVPRTYAKDYKHFIQVNLRRSCQLEEKNKYHFYNKISLA